LSELRRALVLCLVAALALAGLGRLPAQAAAIPAPSVEIAGILVSLCLDGAADKGVTHSDCDHCTIRGTAMPPPPVATLAPPERRSVPLPAPLARRGGAGRIFEAFDARGPPSA
jgi:hypothetical protein